jgi:predicted transcriptional regulator
VNLQRLIYRELEEGMTEKELAAAVRVPPRTLVTILSGKNPQNPAIWQQFATYFLMDVEKVWGKIVR